MLLKRVDFKYPSIEEILAIKDKIPKFSNFGFKYNSSLELCVSNTVPMDEAIRIGNLHDWDICLLNRFGKLRTTYERILVLFNRGISKDFDTDINSSKVLVDTLLFEYYSEVFYYFYFSSLDILAQIICLYYDPFVKEESVSFNERFVKEYNKYILNDNILLTTYEQLKDARDCRNSFTHRFTPLMVDNRASFIENNKKILGAGFGNVEKYDHEFIIKNTNDSMNILADLMIKLKAFFMQDENNKYLFD